ncbi:Hypothetical predicted protein [Pelobates cultripes]|uniref:Uncharacterized protein n=1 Tax=Pelobates cultripes TaxID=61616 RepID=A0AAD1RYL6_PELCU|nr:Hypothetical predicted protein [Pelobates cultripes]
MAAQASILDGSLESDGSAAKGNLALPEESTQLTKVDLTLALQALSTKLISTWQHMTDSMRKDIQELGSRTSHMEDKYDEFTTAHNDLATNVESMAAKIEALEGKLLMNAYAPEIPADMLLVDRVHRMESGISKLRRHKHPYRQ